MHERKSATTFFFLCLSTLLLRLFVLFFSRKLYLRRSMQIFNIHDNYDDGDSNKYRVMRSIDIRAKFNWHPIWPNTFRLKLILKLLFTRFDLIFIAERKKINFLGFHSHCEGGYCAPNIKSTERPAPCITMHGHQLYTVSKFYTWHTRTHSARPF